MKRLSENPTTIRNLIETSEALLVAYRRDLEHTPIEDKLERDTLKREIQAETGTLGRLKRHLDGLEEEFGDMLETANTRAYTPDYDQ